jgi:UDP-N-acetylglucosamine--N-acetylmuramyl-(pentapeptide) pyrophosphoryl-undecaprenol N-acetylglucosamine transferase
VTILISCGGTGGHLSPGIALAEGLIGRGHRAVLLISRKKVDARLVEKYPHLAFRQIPGAPFLRSPAGLLRFLWSQTHAFFFSFGLLRRERPQVIVGFGGFTTASLIVAGVLRGVPVALHEANHVPGRAIRLLGRLARRVYLPPGVGLPGLRRGVTVAAGMPVRGEIQPLPRDESCRALGLDPTLKVVALLGGSQGATALNAWARRQAEPLARAGIQLYVLTGLGKGEDETLAWPAPDGRRSQAKFVSFSDRMATVMSAADLVVSRAGAGTIAELARCGTPAILVPFPHAADNHQAANAAYFLARGGGRVVAQGEIDSLDRDVPALLADEATLQKHRAALRELDRANAVEPMLDDVEALARPAGRSEPLPPSRTLLA